MKYRYCAFALLVAVSAFGQVKTTRFQGRDAWSLESRQARVTIMQSGGHIGEIVLLGPGAVNPLWIQPVPTMDPDRFDPVRDAKLYGKGPAARLMSGILGHNLCFPFWGTPSAAEAAAGMSLHGEAGVLRWKMAGSGNTWFTVAVEMPDSSTRFTRKVSLSGAVVALEETAENLSGWDRPVGWCEHVTLGAPFLERGTTLFDASLTRGYSDEQPGEFAWPDAMAENTRIDLHRMRNVQSGPGFVNHFLVQPDREFGFFAAYNPKSRLVFGYVFPPKDFPWLNVWESVGARDLTRGMEVSNTPVHATMRGLFKNQQAFGTPTFDWLGGKSKLVKRLWAFSARVPENYRGVSDVRWSGEELEIVERETGSRTRLR